MSNFMKIHPDGTDLFHSDGKTEEQTERLDEIFRNFAKEHKNFFVQLFYAEVTRGQIC